MFLLLILSQDLMTMHFNKGKNLYSLQRIELKVGDEHITISTNPLADLLLFPNIQLGYRWKNFIVRPGIVFFSGEALYKSSLGFDQLHSSLTGFFQEVIYTSSTGLFSLRIFLSENIKSSSIQWGNSYKFLLWEVGYDSHSGLLFSIGSKFGKNIFITMGALYPGIDYYVKLPVIPYINIGFFR